MTKARPAYFDTSALLKRYLREPGSSLARRLLGRHRCVVSTIAMVEVASALHRRAASGHLGQRELQAVLALVRRDAAHWNFMEVDRQVLDRAEQVVWGTGVRTLGAVHLASALVAQGYSGSRVVFATGDVRQHDAGGRLGLHVVWVG